MLSKRYTEYFDVQDEAQRLGVKIQNLSDEVDQQKKHIHTLMASCDSLDELYKDVVGSLTTL
jgi:CII-binding regulator of phage lambda lysogenization HflD